MVKLYLDTASIEDILFWKKLDLVHGVTTNPVLLTKEKENPIILLKKICKLSPGPVSAQVTKKNYKEMIVQGLHLSKISKKIVIKLPCNLDGLKAAKILKKKKIKINITLGFDPAQAAAFANLNVDFFSLIIGKTEDWGFSNIDSISACRKIIKIMGSNTKLLVASIRNSEHLKQAIVNEADIITVPPSTWLNIYKNKYTAIGLNSFFSTWKKIRRDYKIKYEK